MNPAFPAAFDATTPGFWPGGVYPRARPKSQILSSQSIKLQSKACGGISPRTSIQENVSWFEITMKNIGGMNVLQQCEQIEFEL